MVSGVARSTDFVASRFPRPHQSLNLDFLCVAHFFPLEKLSLHSMKYSHWQLLSLTLLASPPENKSLCLVIVTKALRKTLIGLAFGMSPFLIQLTVSREVE